ncbi:MAG: response regulator transcription factor [Spirochaetota bacterium]|nr:response regulator transcription factor [Spirochaetota bacterium]
MDTTPHSKARQRVKVVIIDDDKNYVNILIKFLSCEDKIWLYGHYSSGQSFLQGMNTPFRPDICLLDINLGDMSGVQCAEVVQKRWPGCHIIFMTAFPDPKTISEAKRLNADYIEKGTIGEELLDKLIPSINHEKKEQFISIKNLKEDENHRKDYSQLLMDLSSVQDRVKCLSKTQLKVLQYRKSGVSIDEVAHKLGIKRDTVLTHVKRASQKLQIPNLWDYIDIRESLKSKD